jgi:hypothetical protein
VADHQSSGEYLRTTFGLVIAFVAPGAVAVWGIAQISPTVEVWFGTTAEADISGAGFLFVLLASLASGVFISGLRAELLPPLFGLFGAKRAKDLDESKTREDDCRAALRQAVEDFFQYHQFYGNMVFALTLAYFAWLYAGHILPWERPLVLGIWLFSLLALLRSAYYSWKRYCEVEEQILGRRGT